MTTHFHRGRSWTFLQTALTITLSLVSVAVHAQEASKTSIAGDRLSRVRTTEPAIAALIREASAVSATFRGLVDVIDASDGLVYIFSHQCGRLAPACLTMSVTVAGPYRILQVLVNMGRDSTDVKASIGHELRHATEVLSQPHLTTGQDLFFFYERAHTTGGAERIGAVFETDAAIRAGGAVRAELKASQASERTERAVTGGHIASQRRPIHAQDSATLASAPVCPQPVLDHPSAANANQATNEKRA